MCEHGITAQATKAIEQLAESLVSDGPLTGIARLMAELWKTLVDQDMPPHYAAVLTANWMVLSGTTGSGQ